MARAPLHNHGLTANSNGDENAHASSFKKVTMLRVIDEKIEQITPEREQFGKYYHSSLREEVLWNRVGAWGDANFEKKTVDISTNETKENT